MVAIPGAAPFCLDRTEVTVAAYGTCSGCTAPNTGGACNWGVAGRGDHPINCVDWNQAVAFCASRGARLPTEAEWHLAAAGTDGREYPWGNAPPSDQLCWSGAGARTGTCAVGSFPSGRSPYGAEDLSGYVAEWTSTSEGASRVFRGGGWDDYDAAGVRTAFRNRGAPASWVSDLGFRCARGAR
jgi:formylglycine-generating enzyme required for sulfatase activity